MQILYSFILQQGEKAGHAASWHIWKHVWRTFNAKLSLRFLCRNSRKGASRLKQGVLGKKKKNLLQDPQDGDSILRGRSLRISFSYVLYYYTKVFYHITCPHLFSLYSETEHQKNRVLLYTVGNISGICHRMSLSLYYQFPARSSHHIIVLPVWFTTLENNTRISLHPVSSIQFYGS